ncbi:MAG: allantoin permease, partial [Candidatus Fonsibacter sp.]
MLVGWETVLVALATLACQTVFERAGHFDQNIAAVLGFLLSAGLTIISAVIGYQLILKVQKLLSVSTLILTLGFVILTWQKIDFSKVLNQEGESASGFIGVLIFTFAGIGLGWVNCAADYSRYISKTVSNKSVIGWTVFSAS